MYRILTVGCDMARAALKVTVQLLLYFNRQISFTFKGQAAVTTKRS